LHQVNVQGDIMLDRLAPLGSGRDTEIDMIEREMEGGVVVIQPPDVHEHDVEERVDGLIRIEEHVDVREWAPTPSAVPKA
jgi:hypothetical protein